MDRPLLKAMTLYCLAEHGPLRPEEIVERINALTNDEQIAAVERWLPVVTGTEPTT